MELRVKNDATTSHNNWKTFFYNVILKCFQTHCHLLKSQKQTKRAGCSSLSSTELQISTSVRRLQSWYLEKYKTELNLKSISKTEAPQLLKHFFLLKYDKQDKKRKAKNTSRAHHRRTVMVSEDILCIKVFGLLMKHFLFLKE